MKQKALTVVVPVAPTQVAGLLKLLQKMGEDPRRNAYLPLEKSNLTHFARFVVIDPATPADKTSGRLLAFETNFDGEQEDYLRELIQIGAKGLNAVFGCCVEYPGTKDFDGFQKFIEKFSVPYEAFYVAYPGHSLRGVRQNTDIRQRIEAYLGSKVAPRVAKVGDLQKEGKKVGDLMDSPARPFSISLPLFGLAVGLVSGIVFTALLAWLAPGMAVWLQTTVGFLLFPALAFLLLLAVELKELADPQLPPGPIPVPPELVRAEDRITQNQLTHIVDIKPGLFRFLVLRLVLRSINLLARISYNRGALGGIPTIHFARWVILRESRRLLFFSNFDGSWESYLGDFIDKASVGLTGVWSNTAGFPRALFLVFAGAKQGEAFKYWTRSHQIQTQFWYSAHARESVRNILNNIRVREGLAQNLSSAEEAQWRARF